MSSRPNPVMFPLFLLLLAVGCVYATFSIYNTSWDEPAAPVAVNYASLPKDCIASHSNLVTGAEEERPVPCQNPDENICVYTEFPNGVFTPYAGPCSGNAGQTGCVTVIYTEGSWIPYTNKQGGC